MTLSCEERKVAGRGEGATPVSHALRKDQSGRQTPHVLLGQCTFEAAGKDSNKDATRTDDAIRKAATRALQQ